MTVEAVNAILKILGTLGLAVVVPMLWRARRVVCLTTLNAAWWWLLGATLLWVVAWTTTVVTSPVDSVIADQLWYGVAVLMLCPLVSVLGARRPVTRVWTWFVIVPLVLVLSIPLINTWSGGTPFPRLQLELPAVFGYVLVLVMGAGNYFGTRFTLAAMLLFAALSLLVMPLSTLSIGTYVAPETARLWATIAFAAAGLAAKRDGMRTLPVVTPIDRLWLDFRDFFGIVWAKRIQDRINHSAESEKWPVRLELHGLVPMREISEGEPKGDMAYVEHTFRWLLRRFAEPAWIDERLKPQGDSQPIDR